MAVDDAPRPKGATAPPSAAHGGRSAWLDRVPAEPPTLDDRRLFDSRDPAERPALALAVGLVVFITVALFRVNDTVAMVMGAIIALWVGTLVYNVITEVKQFASGAEVTPTQCSDLYP